MTKCRLSLMCLLAVGMAVTSFAPEIVAQERRRILPPIFNRDRQSNVPPVVLNTGPVSESEAQQLGMDAYIYGYPLVTMEMSRRVMTNVEKPEGTRAPMGHLVRMKEYPSADFRDVTAPNADTLYTTGWIDVNKEPYVLSIPDAHDRYYLFPLLDGWTDVFQVPGKRTTGTGPQKYAIVGPYWKGTLPEGVTEYRSPTSIVWILGRIYCTGTPADYEAVHAMQKDCTLVPLSSYGKAYTPPDGKVDSSIDMKTAVRDQVNRLDAGEYFKLLATLLKDNPPSINDDLIVAKMKRLGIERGLEFDITKVDPNIAKGLKDVPRMGVERIMAHFRNAGVDQNGWTFATQAGLYGTNYIQRALIAAIGLGANRPQDAVYPTSEKDASGREYSGANKYVMHFNRGMTPPADAFWSITMYNGDYFFVQNPLNKYTVSPRNQLKYNSDGSLDIYIQNENPGPEKEANWLPAPSGKFILMLRMYWPKERDPSIINGSWRVPPVTMVR